MSASKFAAKKSVPQATKPTATKHSATKVEVAQDKPFVDPVVEEAMKTYGASQQALLGALKLPSGTRVLVAAVAGIISYASTIWFAVPLLEAITIAALSLTGSAFLGFLVYVLGYFALIIGSIMAGYQTFKFVASFDFEQAADVGRGVREAAKRRVSQVRGWFTRSDSADDIVAA